MDSDQKMLQETYRLARENNRMLHAMRRNAFWGGLIKFVFYILILVVAPLWFYGVYLAPIVQSMQQTTQQFQGTSAKAQAQLLSLQDAWKQFESKFGFGSSSQSR